MFQWIMKNIFIVITALIALQLFLVWLNMDVTITVVNNISWWIVFIPVYVVIVYLLFLWLILRNLRM
jgi:hypothetical protein